MRDVFSCCLGQSFIDHVGDYSDIRHVAHKTIPCLSWLTIIRFHTHHLKSRPDDFVIVLDDNK